VTQPPSTATIPIPTPDAAQTQQAGLFGPHDDGFFLVNVDIAPGVWRSDGNADNCYWKTSTATGDIIDNHFGMAGGTAYIGPTDFQVEFDGCGTWTYLQGP
jgi:hypothetical protein